MRAKCEIVWVFWCFRTFLTPLFGGMNFFDLPFFCYRSKHFFDSQSPNLDDIGTGCLSTGTVNQFQLYWIRIFELVSFSSFWGRKHATDLDRSVNQQLYRLTVCCNFVAFCCVYRGVGVNKIKWRWNVIPNDVTFL